MKMILSGKSRQVDVIGAGGHARAVIALLERCEFTVAGVYDESYTEGTGELIAGIKLRGTSPLGDNQIVLAIGDNRKRADMALQYTDRLLKRSIIHPSVIIEKDVVLGDHNLIMPGVILNTEAQVGWNNILNSRSVIEHETKVGDHNHISVGAVLCGRVTVGNYCFVGAGAVIIDKISVTDHVIIGAGAVVVRNITEPGTYVGNPARKIK
jgi:UDP-N-acetylbacillosamine N-acetyltransferase